MDHELEVAGAASAGGWLRWRKAHTTLPPGEPCPNCETVLQGAYCHSCGQLAETFERSIPRLLVEGIESFFHFDGRFWQTVPKLVWRPGRLTSEYIGGKRAFQIPPLRLFLVVLVLVFFTGSLGLGGGAKANFNGKALSQMSPQERAEFEKDMKAAHIKISPGGAPVLDANDAEPIVKSTKPGEQLKGNPTVEWLNKQGHLAAQNRELFMMVLESWAHRFAFLLLPISALLLALLFVFQRRFYVFDHLIFSMHSLSFQGLLLSLGFLLAPIKGVGDILFLIAPVHLFVHMRGTYQTSIFGTLLRMVLLCIGTMIAVAFLAIGLIWIGLATMKAG